jgi:RNA polymerase sigma-70 factor (ECF subfamily)
MHQLGNREEAEDATQITFLNAFRGLRRGTSPEFESAWLYKIAQNVCLTKQRNSYRRRMVEAPADFEVIEELVPAHERDSDELFGLTKALRVIPEQQRRALLLREWKGLSYREIADEMQLSQAAVETLLFRARRSLAGALTDGAVTAQPETRPARRLSVVQ